MTQIRGVIGAVSRLVLALARDGIEITCEKSKDKKIHKCTTSMPIFGILRIVFIFIIYFILIPTVQSNFQLLKQIIN